MQQYNFVKNRFIAYGISIVTTIASLIFFFTHGLNLSIEFSSGSILRVHFDEPSVTKEAVEKVLAMDKFKDKFIKPVVQEVSAGNTQGAKGKEFFINSGFLSSNPKETDIQSQLVIEFQKTWPSATALEFVNVGPTIGEDLKHAAIVSVILSVLIVLIYITFRFEFRFAVVSIIAPVHDVIIVVGIFALLGEEFSSSTIAAVLTMIGYSLNDTVIILDRLRENLKLMRKESFDVIVNASVVQTLSRTIRTSVTVFLPVVTMFFFGGLGLHSFALVMLIGVIVSTYTSINVTSMVLVDWYATDKKNEVPLEARV